MFRRDFLSLSMFSFLGFGKSNKVEEKDELINSPKFWEHPCQDVSKHFTPECMADVEKQVVKWLETSSEPFVFFSAKERSFYSDLIFWRSEINIKSCYNVWEVWHIATCRGYPKILSSKVKEVGTNEVNAVDNGFVMPNEIRTSDYKTT